MSKSSAEILSVGPASTKRIQAADVHGSANWDDLIALNRIVAGDAGEGRRLARALDRGGG